MHFATVAFLVPAALTIVSDGTQLNGEPIGSVTTLAQSETEPHPARHSNAPAPAAAVGYTTRTFGPTVKLGEKWSRFGFYGSNPAATRITQNANGSLTVAGGGNNYNAQVATAFPTSTGQRWEGIAFGGGGYFEATLSFTGAYTTAGGWPAFWSHDIQGLAGTGSSHWKGQIKGYLNEIEIDFMEFDTGPNSYGGGMHHWYGNVAGTQVSTTENQPFILPAGTDTTKPHRYGFLWVPATAKERGYVRFYFDGAHIPGWDKSWNRYDESLPPAPVDGHSAYSVLDARHLVLLLGTGPNNPMTVYGLEVWQASDANNLVRPLNRKPQY